MNSFLPEPGLSIESSPATAPEIIRVLLVDDDPMVRTGISMILSSASDLKVVGSVGDGSEVVAAVERYRPHVVLIDIRMKTMDGIAATRVLRALPDAPSVIMLTAFDVDHYVVDSIIAGAEGFLLKDEEPLEIISGIRKVARGEPALSSRSSRRLLNYVAFSSQLSVRETAQKSWHC